jgi:hypothetical protein
MATYKRCITLDSCILATTKQIGQVNRSSRFRDISGTRFKNMVSRKTCLKFNIQIKIKKINKNVDKNFFQTYMESSTPGPYSEPSPDVAASKASILACRRNILASFVASALEARQGRSGCRPQRPRIDGLTIPGISIACIIVSNA